MIIFSPRSARLKLGVVCLLLSAKSVCAQQQTQPASHDDDSGFAVLANTTNVTHWGLGAGVGIQSSPYRGYGSKVSPIPLLYFDDKWVHLLGTTVDLKVGKWYNVSVALRARFGLFDGYSQSDAPILNGMQDRKGAIWYGPALAWQTPYGTLTGDFLLGGNKGEQAKIEFGRKFRFDRFSIEPHIGAQWLSNKYVNYYYGVMPSEVRVGRPAYTGKSTWAFSVGSQVDYRLTQHQRLLLDVGVAHLGGGITDSPLVGKRYVPEARIGYLYQFR